MSLVAMGVHPHWVFIVPGVGWRRVVAMRWGRRISAMMVVLGLADSVTASQINVLIYGNRSLGASPTMLQAFCPPGADTLSVQSLKVCGASLGYFLTQDSATGLLDDRAWDYVVLEDTSGWSEPSQVGDTWLSQSVRQWDALIKEKAPTAQTILMVQPMLVPYMPHMDHVGELYEALAQELGAKVAPAGQAFKLSMDERPEVRLLDNLAADSGFTTLSGDYLSTLVLFGTITGRSPVEMLNLRVITGEQNAWLKDVAVRTLAVPEPAAALSVLALGVLGMSRRRRA